MKFLKGAPRFAAEVRSEGDYGPAAEQAIAEKRDDYFAAGTLVVWDVDLLSKDVVPASTCAPIRVFQRFVVAATSPRPNLPCRGGRCRSMICLSGMWMGCDRMEWKKQRKRKPS